MHRFKPYEAVVAALRDSQTLSISGPEGEEEITRKAAYNPNSGRSRFDLATVYVKGFGDEDPSTQFDIEAFFTKFGTVNSVRLRRTAEKLFKGSAFIEFQDEETVKKFLELEPKPQWRGHDLKIMSKSAYVEEKNELIRQGKIEPSSNSNARFFEGREFGGRHRGSGRGRGGRDSGRSRDVDPDDWKKRREDDQRNGLKDNHNRHGGRGGRGRGRDHHRDGRNGRNERSKDNDAKPAIQPGSQDGEAVKEKVAGAPEVADGKHARDADGDADEPPAKKLDTKAVVSVDAS